MRRNWQGVALGLVIVLLAAGTLSCAKRQPAISGSGPGAEVDSVQATQIPDPPELAATLATQGGGRASGTAELLPGASGSEIVVKLQGLAAGAYVGYIYHSSCDGTGEKHGPLTAFSAAADGAGTSATRFLALRLVHFIEEPHFTAIHSGAPGTLGPLVACGKIEAKS